MTTAFLLLSAVWTDSGLDLMKAFPTGISSVSDRPLSLGCCNDITWRMGY
jgi:hypothetical protein